MAIAESRKRANAKWDKENMTTLGCKIKRTQAAKFKSYCENQGSTSNTTLKEFVLGCIGEQEATPQSTVVGENHTEVALSQEVLKTVQDAAASTGETVPQFIGRAVQTQVQLDKTSLTLGIDPATADKIGKE